MTIMKRIERAFCLSGYSRAARELWILGYEKEANHCMKQYNELKEYKQ